MAGLFQPKRVMVPGLLSDQGLADRVKELTTTLKTNAAAAPPSDSAFSQVNQITNEALKPNPELKVVAPRPAAAALSLGTSKADRAGDRSAKIGSDIASAVQSIPGVQQAADAIVQAGTLTPEQQVSEQANIVAEMKAQEAAVKESQRLIQQTGDLMNKLYPDEQEPDALQSALEREAAKRRAQIEAAANTAEAEKTLPTQAWWLNAAQVASRSAAQMGVGTLRYPADIWDTAAALAAGKDKVTKSDFSVYMDGVDKALTDMLPGDKARSKQFVTDLAAGAGSMTGFLITGWAGRAIGIPAGISTGVLGAAVEGDSVYQDADGFGATPTQKFISLVLGSGLGVTEAIPIDRMFMRADVASGGKIRNLLAHTTSGSLEEFIQEAGQALGEDLVAKYGAGYDPNRELDVGKYARAGAVGAILGGAAGAITSTLSNGEVLDQGVADEAQQTEALDRVFQAEEARFAEIVGAEDTGSPDGQGAVAAADAGAVESAPVSDAPARARVEPVTIDQPRGDAVQRIIEQQKPAAAASAAPVETATQQDVVLNPEAPVEQQTSVQVAPQTSSPQFKEWFGASRGVTAEGAPQVFYHGTRSDFDAFERVDGGNAFGGGFYFTRDPGKASDYATGENVNRMTMPGNAGPNVVPVYLKFDKPFNENSELTRGELNAIEKAANALEPGTWKRGELARQFDRAYPPKGNNVLYQLGLGDAANEVLRRVGYDALETGYGTIVFEPTQIKSAIGNSGAFDPNDPRIDRQQADLVTPDTMVAAADPAPNLTPLPGATGTPSASAVQAVMAYAAASRLPITRQTQIYPPGAPSVEAPDFSTWELGKTATMLAKRLGAKKVGEGANYARLSGDEKRRSRYYRTADNKEVRISDHDNRSAIRADLDIVFDYSDSMAQITRKGQEPVVLWRDHPRPWTLNEGEVDFKGDGAAWSRAVVAEVTGARAAATPAQQELSSLYDEMLDQPDDPAVHSSYQSLVEEVTAQYAFAIAANGGDLPRNPDTPSYPADHPLAPVADQFWSLYRFFGTGLEGATDAENMWQAYARVFSASALPAFTTETRGPAGWEAAHGEPLPQRKIGLMRSTAWQYDLEQVLAQRTAAVANPDVEAMTGTATMRQPFIGEPTRPTQGIPTPAGYQRSDDVKLTTLSRALSDILDLTVRQGRIVGGKEVMGEYSRRTATIRLRTASDFSTLAHEAGHAINDSMAEPLNAFIQANSVEVRAISRYYAGDLSAEPNMTVMREGFAEFFRLYVTDPQFLRVNHPTAIENFEAVMRQVAPKTLAGLNSITNRFSAWVLAPSRTIIRNQIVSGRREIGFAAAWKELRDNGFKSFMRERVLRTVQWSANRYAPLVQLVDDLVVQGERNRGTPLELKTSENPAVILRQAIDSGDRAMIEMTDGVIGYRSVQSFTPGMRDGIVIALGYQPNDVPPFFDEERLADFSAYLVARRALDEFRRWEAGELDRAPVGFSKGDAVQAVKEYEEKYGEAFTRGAAIMHQYNMGLWQKEFEAGRLSQETYQDGLQREFYVPLQRDMSDKKAAFGDSALTAGSRTSGKLGPAVRRFYGSDRDIIDPLAVMMHKTIALERAIAYNDAAKFLAILADRVGAAGALVERIPASRIAATQLSVRQIARQLASDDSISETDAADLLTILDASMTKGTTLSVFHSEQASTAGENVLFFWENGKAAAIQLNNTEAATDVVNLMNATGREALEPWAELLAGTSRVFQNSITKWPDFLFINYIRGEIEAWIKTRGYVPFVSGIRGIADEIRQKQDAKLYNIGAGIMGGMNSTRLHQARVERDIKALRTKGYVAQVIGDISNPWDFVGISKALDRTVGITETGNRRGIWRATFDRARAEGLNVYDANIEATYTATAYMDFGLNGSGTLHTRRLIPFLNAQIQSLYRGFQLLGGDMVARRRGLKFAVGAYFKNIENLPLSREERNALLTGRSMWLKMIGFGAIVAALVWQWIDDPDYQDTSEYLRTTGLVIPLRRFGLGKQGDVLWLPWGFETAIIANGFTRGLEAVRGDREAGNRFLRSVMFNATPPTSNPLQQLGMELATGIDFYTGRPIVPDTVKGKRSSDQYDQYTSNFAKWVGATTGMSPMIVDHIGAGFGASAYRDITTLLNAADPTRPAMDANDWPILRRFVRDSRRGSVSAQDFWAQASTTNGKLTIAANTYKDYVEGGNVTGANRYLSTLSGDERAYAVLMTNFNKKEQSLNPFYRARQVTTILSKMRRENASAEGLGDTTLDMSAEEMRQFIMQGNDLPAFKMPASKKAEIDDVLSELARREVRNTMIATGQPGWYSKKPLPLQPTLDLLLEVSPETYDEYQRRTKKAKVYDAQAVYDLWPDVRERLINDGEYAVLSDAVAIAGVVF